MGIKKATNRKIIYVRFKRNKEAKVSSDKKAVAEQELVGEQKKVEQLLRKNEELDERVEFLE